MSRVAIVAGPDPGHAFPAIGLGVALRDRGHDVGIWTGPDHESGVRGEELAFALLPFLAPQAADVDLAHRLWDRAGQMAPPLAGLLRDFRPDVVVSDTLTTAGAFAAELLDVPWVELIPHHLVDPDPAIPPVGLGRRPSRNVLRRADDRLIRRRQAVSLAEGRAHRDRVRHQLGLQGEGRPQLRLVCSFPELEYRRSRWPGDTHLVGALAWEPDWAPLAVPSGSEPLVVVTDSTASTVTRSLATAALRGLRRAGVRLVVTTSHPHEPWPHGCTVGRGPHGPLLDRAAVAVGPGGGGFVSKALTRGVPLVVVPIMGDQRETAGRVVAAGVGLRLPPAAVTATTLRATVHRVLHDRRFGAAAREVARNARDRGLGAGLAARLVAEAALGQRPVARGPQR